MARIEVMALVLAALIAVGVTTSPAAPRRLSVAMPAPDDAAHSGGVSVLTYNVHGLPWPIAQGRSPDLVAIGARLKAMRDGGEAPRIVVLQEAFTADAQRIGRAAGYRHIVNGPGADMADIDGREDMPDGHWWSGETEGKWLGSGLQILSDYPVIAVHRIAFPACAGYDCLANKGAVLARIAVPGAAGPVDVLTTHLNSRGASGVGTARSDAAYRTQIASLDAFVARAHDPRYPLIVAGDFNIGQSMARRTAMFGGSGPDWHAADALHAARRRGIALPPDAMVSLRLSKDWQFFTPGTRAALEVTGIAVPFGRDADGAMLSDHVGYVARYRLRPVSRPVTRIVPPTA